MKNVGLLLEYTKAIVSVVQFVISHFECCSFKEADGHWTHKNVDEVRNGESFREKKREHSFNLLIQDDDDTQTLAPSEIVLEIDIDDLERLEAIRMERARKDPLKPPLPTGDRTIHFCECMCFKKGGKGVGQSSTGECRIMNFGLFC